QSDELPMMTPIRGFSICRSSCRSLRGVSRLAVKIVQILDLDEVESRARNLAEQRRDLIVSRNTAAQKTATPVVPRQRIRKAVRPDFDAPCGDVIELQSIG